MSKWAYFVVMAIAFSMGCGVTRNYYEMRIARLNESHAVEQAKELAAERDIHTQERLEHNAKMAETQRHISSLTAELDRVRANANKLRASSNRSDRDHAGYCDLGAECGALLIQALEAVRHCQR